MLQRTGIALAILGDPKLLILDEPTAGLDPRERVRFRNLIHALAADRIVILSTHIVSDVETIAGQIILLRDHRLYCCASPAEICAPYQGKVFLLPAGTPLEHGQTLLSEGQGTEGTFLRVLCDRPPGRWRASTTHLGGCLPGHLWGGAAMKRVGWEWRKLLTLPALWGFLALCLAFNGLLMANAPGDRQTFGEISATARALGQRVAQDFVEGLASALPPPCRRP